MVDFEEYKVAFDFMFRFVETFFENYPDDKNVGIIYHQFYVIRKELENGNEG